MTNRRSTRMPHHHRSPFVLAVLLMFASLHASHPAAAAGPPSELNSSMPSRIKLVGTALGVVDLDGAFEVVVRDADALPCPGVTVTLDVSGTDVGFASAQPVVTYLSCTQVSAVTDQDGRAYFVVVGGGTNQSGDWSLTSLGTITAGTTLLGTVGVAAFDLDGVDGSTLNDFHLLFGPLFAGEPYPPVMDYNDDGLLDALDISISLSHILSLRSSDPQLICGNPPSGAVPLVGPLEIKLAPDCLTDAPTAFCSGTRTDLVFKVTSPVALENVTSIMVDLSIIGPPGVALPAFWRFDHAGCHSNGLQVLLPSSSASSCYDGSALFTDAGDLTTVDAFGGTSTTYPAPSGSLSESRTLLGLVATTRYVGPGIPTPGDTECTFGYGTLPFLGANVAFALRVRNTTPCGDCATSPPVKFRLNSITVTTAQPADWGYDMDPKECVGVSPQGRGEVGGLAGALGPLFPRGGAQPSTIVLYPDGSGSNIITTDGSTTDVTPPTGSTSSLWLAAAAPNPSSAGTTLAFGLPGSQHVRVAIVDVAGRIVRVLADGPLGAGEHRLGWDGSDDSGARVRPGVYYCRLVTGGARRSTAIVLAR